MSATQTWGSALFNVGIPVASVMIALVSVVIGPVLSLRIAKRQIEASAAVAHKQVIAPMRVKWIEELRELVSQVLSTTKLFYMSQSASPRFLSERETPERVYDKVHTLNQKIELMINPTEEPHRLLVEKLSELWQTMTHGNMGYEKFFDRHAEATALSQQIFKAEWERVKRGV